MSRWKIHQGDCLQVLAELPEKHFHCCVTSPPYFGLRSYLKKDDSLKAQELGSEQTPAEYVARMVEVARGVRRLLRDDGALWLNVGDSYGRGNGSDKSRVSAGSKQQTNRGSVQHTRSGTVPSGFQDKSLCLIPQRLLLALADDGWIVRSIVRWFKVSPMPESCRDRPTSAVEEIFLLTKSGRYYYDQEAERPALVKGQAGSRFSDGKTGENMGDRCSKQPREDNPIGRNLWNWWEVVEEGSGSWFMANEPLKYEHYAAFPSKLPERCIRLGTSQHGCCSECGTPWQRIIERKKIRRKRPNELTKRQHEDGTGNTCANTVAGTATETLGWEPGCKCGREDVAPCRVLDPFCGTATTILAALRLGRDGVGIELNPKDVEFGKRRLIADNPLFNGMSESYE